MLMNQRKVGNFMKTTTTTESRNNVQTVPTYYEYLYNVANGAVNAVLRNRYNQTGVSLYRELNEYHNNAHDKALYNAMCGGYGLADLEAEKKQADKLKAELKKAVDRISKKAVDLTATATERKAIAKELHTIQTAYKTATETSKALTEDIRAYKNFDNSGYSDRMVLINSAMGAFVGYIWDNAKDYDENASERFKAMCKAISESMAELANPQTENTYRNYKVRTATAEEIKAFSERVGGIGKEYKYYSTSYGAYRTFYTIEEKNGERWIIKHYATVNQYQYIESMGTNEDGEEVTLDSVLTKACKQYTRYDNYFVNDMGDLESLLELMENIRATEREQLFIKEVGKVSKLYDDVKDVLKIAMVRRGIVSAGAQWTFMSRLRKKLTDNGYTYKSVRTSKIPYNKAVKVTEGKRIDLLEWTDKEPIQADFKKCVDWVDVSGKCESVTPTPRATAKQCKVLWTMFESVDKNKSNSPLRPIVATIITMSPTANIFNGKAEVNRTYLSENQTYTVLEID